jgi:hypothetical protein
LLRLKPVFSDSECLFSRIFGHEVDFLLEQAHFRLEALAELLELALLVRADPLRLQPQLRLLLLLDALDRLPLAAHERVQVRVVGAQQRRLLLLKVLFLLVARQLRLERQVLELLLLVLLQHLELAQLLLAEHVVVEHEAILVVAVDYFAGRRRHHGAVDLESPRPLARLFLQVQQLDVLFRSPVAYLRHTMAKFRARMVQF